jgi:hypothetical protein
MHHRSRSGIRTEPFELASKAIQREVATADHFALGSNTAYGLFPAPRSVLHTSRYLLAYLHSEKLVCIAVPQVRYMSTLPQFALEPTTPSRSGE